MEHLIIGLGQVGQGVQKVLECEAHDPSSGVIAKREYDVLHICYSYSDDFVQSVLDYKKKFKAKYIVIHSTVPVGTSTKCGAVHSPIRGVHPHLEQSIRVFVKYFGGFDAEVMAEEFRKKGVKCTITPKPETTELGKLVDTTTYGINILIEKEIHRLSQKHNVDFDLAYTDMNDTYNKGYIDVGMPQFHKYNIKHMEGPIGGHCILPNAELFDSWIADIIIEKNKLYEN